MGTVFDGKSFMFSGAHKYEPPPRRVTEGADSALNTHLVRLIVAPFIVVMNLKLVKSHVVNNQVIILWWRDSRGQRCGQSASFTVWCWL